MLRSEALPLCLLFATVIRGWIWKVRGGSVGSRDSDFGELSGAETDRRENRESRMTVATNVRAEGDFARFSRSRSRAGKATGREGAAGGGLGQGCRAWTLPNPLIQSLASHLTVSCKPPRSREAGGVGRHDAGPSGGNKAEE